MFSEDSQSSGVSFWNILSADVFFWIILTASRLLYIVHFWNLFQPCGRNARSSQMGFRGQQLAYSHQNRGLYNKLYIPSRVQVYISNSDGLKLKIPRTKNIKRVSKYGDNHADLECPIKVQLAGLNVLVMEAFSVSPKFRHSKWHR